MFALINNLTLHYKIEGEAHNPPLVFINSLGTDLRLWDEVAAKFADRYRLILYDKRGHGLSDSPAGPYSIRDHADDLAGLLAHLKVEAATLVGLSIGGMIAMDYALQCPERIKALVLCDTAPRIGTVESWNDRIQLVRKQGLAALAETLTGRWFARAFASQHPAKYRGYLNMLARMPLEGYVGTCAALRDADLREGAKAMTAPSLVLCGSEDVATPPSLVIQFAESLPNAHFEIIEEAAHLPCVEQPEAVAAAIGRFFRDGKYER